MTAPLLADLIGVLAGALGATARTRAYVAGGRAAHLVAPGGESLCGTRPRPGRRWLGTRDGRERGKAASLPLCRSCVKQDAVLRQVAAWDGPPPAPGVVAVVTYGGRKWKVAACADCERVRPVCVRGLCTGCAARHTAAGTIGGYGWVRADRIAEYRSLRDGGMRPSQAAARIGVTVRTAQRYERALRTGAAA